MKLFRKRTIYDNFITAAEGTITVIISDFQNQMSIDYKCVTDIKDYWIDFLKKAKKSYPEDYKRIVDNNAEDVKKWALSMVSSKAFDNIASGKYHIQDVLTTEGEALANLYRYCLKEALRYRYIDDKTLEKQFKTLQQQIYETGLWA